MGEGEYVTQGIIVGHENARFFDSMELVQKPPGRLPGSRFPVDQLLSITCSWKKIAEGRIGAGK
jgi:hypothetical protein